MAQEIEQVVQVLPPEQPKRKPGNPFKPGHPRYGGRQKGPIKRSREAQEIVEKMGFCPVEFLATIAQRGVMVNPDGTETTVAADMRLDAAKAVAPYVRPKLSATQVTGRDGTPLAVVGFDMSKLMADPDMVEAAQLLALRMSESDGARQVEAGPELADE